MDTNPSPYLPATTSTTSTGLPEPVTTDAASVAAAWLLGHVGNTRAAYTRDLRDFGAFCERVGVDPLKATRPVIEAYARGLEETRGLSRATVARRLAALSGFYSYAVDEGVIARSPVARVRRPRYSRESPSLGLERAELRRILDAAETSGPRDHAIAALLALNGLRVSEICGADVDDLGTERGHNTLTITRKGGTVSQVPLAPRTEAAITEHLGDRTTGPLILANDGGRLDRFDAGRIVRRLARRAKIAHKVSPHDCRHGFITAALDAGVPLRDVQDAAGHADPRTTRRYDRARHSLDRHATYAVARYVA